MKAMIIRESGEPSVFEAADIPVPQIGSTQVLVRVAATSVNPVDWKIRKFAPPLGPDYPAVLHGDVAGVVEAVGADVAPGGLCPVSPNRRLVLPRESP